MAPRKTDFTGDRFGDWVVTARAKPIDGKRAWIVTNTVTDETRTVLQTELKNLGTESCPADENCSITEDGKHEMPSSAEITRKVVLGNYKEDLFGIPDGILPEIDDESSFAVSFVEPIGTATVTEDEFGVNVQFNIFDQLSIEDCCDETCNCEPDKIVIDLGTPRPLDDRAVEQIRAAGIQADPLVKRESPWLDGATKEWLRVAELARQLSDAICDTIEARS